MQPEDIDKLFRAKLEQHATPPPPNLWVELQEQLEPPKERKRRGGFVMYALAAAVTLLLVAGAGWMLLHQRPAGSGASGSLATAPHLKSTLPAPPSAGSAAADVAQPAPADALAHTETPTSGAGKESADQKPVINLHSPAASAPQQPLVASAQQLKNNHPVQATPAAPAPSTLQQAASRMAARTDRPAAPAQHPAAGPTSVERQALALNMPKPEPITSVPSSAPAPATAVAAGAAAGLPKGTIEVEVRESAPVLAQAAAPAEADEEVSHQRRLLGAVKQLGRVVRGQRPDLTEVGLPANPTLTLQAHVAGRTLTKSISL